MRSHDYCHFEMSLPIGDDDCPDDVRIEAAQHVDRAVAQYIRRKAVLALKCEGWKETQLKEAAEAAEKVEAEKRTPEQQAELKAYKDYCFWKNRDFDYQYDIDDDYDQE